ncbi:c-type cytochrome [Nitrospira sp. Nam74]
MPRLSSRSRSAKAVPSSGKTQGNAKCGQNLYGQNCPPCHGLQGLGGVGPKLAGNHVLMDTARCWETVLNGRGGMPPWGPRLSGQDIADIHSWPCTLTWSVKEEANDSMARQYYSWFFRRRSPCAVRSEDGWAQKMISISRRSAGWKRSLNAGDD